MAIFLLLLLITISYYIYLIYGFHDFRFKKLTLNIFKKKEGKSKVLFVFPHPDDETVTSGGLINKLSMSDDYEVHLVCLTKGEKGNELIDLDENELAKVREKEFSKAVEILGVKNYELKDFGDGEIERNYQTVKKYIQDYIQNKSIDFVVTFERTGMYGHKDHVFTSKAVNEIHDELRSFKTLYTTIPEKLERRDSLRIHMKNIELEEFDLNEQPEFYFPTYRTCLLKYRAARVYKSQNLSHNMPLFAKMFLVCSVEYYTTKYKSE